jgi:hypothetical protein
MEKSSDDLLEEIGPEISFAWNYTNNYRSNILTWGTTWRGVRGFKLLLFGLNLKCDITIVFPGGTTEEFERHDKQDNSDARASELA